MEFKGTKGKWKYYHELNDNKIISKKYQFIVSTKKGNGLFVTGFNSNPHEKEANALLISKAPEMLEMLKSCYDRLYLLGLQKGDINSEPLIRLTDNLIKEATEI